MHGGLIIIFGEIVPVGSVVKGHRSSLSEYFITSTLGEEKRTSLYNKHVPILVLTAHNEGVLRSSLTYISLTPYSKKA